MNGGALRSSDRCLLVLVACALACVAISLVLGAAAVLYYIPGIAVRMKAVGVSLVQLRPLHTTFASAWIYLGAVTVVHKFLFDAFGEPTRADRRRFKWQMACWGIAGLGVLVTLPLGITSGREYLGFHPMFSVPIVIGWVLFGYTFFKKVWRGFWARPVYVYMWATGILYFLYTFAEGHAYLLPRVRDYPVADLQIQWKSCGTLVASFNQMVYGSLIFLGERISGDRRIGQSRTAFALFGVGLLNSFTNYAHHTYHIPQSELVKWTAFAVSMLEILILVQVFKDVTSLIRRGKVPAYRFRTSARFLELSKCWNLFLLTVAILISVPPLNSLIHGTHVVMAHAMGSELAIDSYILFAAFAWLLAEIFPKREVQETHVDDDRVRWTITYLNVSLICLVGALLAGGLVTGTTRFLGLERPAWMDDFPYVFAVSGFAFAYFLVRLLLHWIPLFVAPARHRAWG